MSDKPKRNYRLRMPSTNMVIISGNLTRDPQRHNIPNYDKYEFGIAHNDPRKNSDGEWEQDTTFVQCVAWGKLCETVSKLRQGDAVLVEGKLKQETWTDERGGKKSKTRVVAFRVSPLEWTDDAPAQPSSGGQPLIPEDDIPF